MSNTEERDARLGMGDGKGRFTYDGNGVWVEVLDRDGGPVLNEDGQITAVFDYTDTGVAHEEVTSDGRRMYFPTYRMWLGTPLVAGKGFVRTRTINPLATPVPKNCDRMWGIRPQYASLLFPGPGTENVPWLDEEGAVRVSLLDIRYDRPSPKDRTPEEYDAYLERVLRDLNDTTKEDGTCDAASGGGSTPSGG